MGLIHGIPGNLSVRVPEGMVITPAGKDLAEVGEGDLVLVTRVNEEARMVKVSGRLLPSSEAFMHWLAYRARPDSCAVVHFHDDGLLESGRMATTEESHPYGTLELARSAAKALKKSRFIRLKGHGFLVAGRDLKDCNAMIAKAEKAKK
jgi:ribulose-5-phosphate 4-epimerase/fuculose-1-phosphate aldolase